MYSHIHDALQYLMLGAGEGRQLLSNQKPLQTFNAKKIMMCLNEDQSLDEMVYGLECRR